jgi:predicted SprT family Zn-dependent metalloprotease
MALFFDDVPTTSQRAALKELGFAYNSGLTYEGKRTKGWVVTKKKRREAEVLIAEWTSPPKPLCHEPDVTNSEPSGSQTPPSPETFSIRDTFPDAVAAISIAEELMTQHGLLCWTVKLSASKRAVAACHMQSKTIKLSSKWIGHISEEQIKESSLHEIAHALTPGHHHDEVWKAKARSIGCTGMRCARFDSSHLAFKYTISCRCGANNLQRDRLETKWEEKICKLCGHHLTVTKNRER